jgi:hypothetical protein
MPINYSTNYSVKHSQLSTLKVFMLKTSLLKTSIFKGTL